MWPVVALVLLAMAVMAATLLPWATYENRALEFTTDYGAGAVGYVGFSGNMDMCINIRTVVVTRRRAFIQAGAGIVADSNPTAEYEETRDKARAMIRALELAQGGL